MFTSSVAPPKAHATYHTPAAHRTHFAHRPFANHTVAPSPLAAGSDLWSGFKAPAKSSPLSAATAYSAGQGGGLSTQMVVGALILGLGLAGLFGGAFLSISRRRKAGTQPVGGKR